MRAAWSAAAATQLIPPSPIFRTNVPMVAGPIQGLLTSDASAMSDDRVPAINDRGSAFNRLRIKRKAGTAERTGEQRIIDLARRCKRIARSSPDKEMSNSSQNPTDRDT